SFSEMRRTLLGFDPRKERLPSCLAGYRRRHYAFGVGLNGILNDSNGPRYSLYDHELSADLLSLAARLQAADAGGEKLEIDPQVIEQRDKLIEFNRTREQAMEQWLTQLADHRGQRVVVGGTAADLTQAALKGR